jgi:quercetin dioxygenase-like cupin family protein
MICMHKTSLDALARPHLENPGEATVQVLFGRVRLLAGAASWDGRQGDLLVIPPRHALDAVETAVILLTVAKHD